jgi:HPt (histidine-containing phosphotransfer) domain-containing protein
MTSTKERRRCAASSGGRGVDSEELRVAFHARLQSERVHFVTLSAALARVEESPTWIFHDLRDRAHKLRGTAAIFEMDEVAAAARSLEKAAASASMSHADNTDSAVWTALVALVRLMGSIDADETAVPAATPNRVVEKTHHPAT